MLVSEQCFGTMTFGGVGYWSAIGKMQQEEVNAMMRAVVDAGINFIDTANVYSLGSSERLLGQSLKDLGIPRQDLVIATKVRGRMAEGPNHVGLSRYHIFQSVEDSLNRLQMDHIDLLYVHGVDALTDMEEIVHALHDIVQSGKVRYVGVCNWPAWMVMKALGIAQHHGWHRFVAMQYYYSLSSRDIERDIIPLAQDQHLALMPWSPLAGGFLSGKYTRQTEKAGNSRRDEFDFPPVNREKAYPIIDALLEIGAAHGVSAAEVALAWVRLQPGVTSTIIGAKRIDQLSQNVHSTSLDLHATELKRLNELSQLAPEYPGWMVERQMSDRKG